MISPISAHNEFVWFLEQREVAFLSPCKVCENLNFSTEIQIFEILLGDNNAIYLCSKIISTLPNTFQFQAIENEINLVKKAFCISFAVEKKS